MIFTFSKLIFIVYLYWFYSVFLCHYTATLFFLAFCISNYVHPLFYLCPIDKHLLYFSLLQKMPQRTKVLPFSKNKSGGSKRGYGNICLTLKRVSTKYAVVNPEYWQIHQANMVFVTTLIFWKRLPRMI